MGKATTCGLRVLIYLFVSLAVISVNAEAGTWRPVPGPGFSQPASHMPFRPVQLTPRQYSLPQRGMYQRMLPPMPVPANPYHSSYPRATVLPPRKMVANYRARPVGPQQQRFVRSQVMPAWRPQQNVYRQQPRNVGNSNVPMFARQYGWRPAMNPWIARQANTRMPGMVPGHSRMAYRGPVNRFRPVAPRTTHTQRFPANSFAMPGPAYSYPGSYYAQQHASVANNPWGRPYPMPYVQPGSWRDPAAFVWQPPYHGMLSRDPYAYLPWGGPPPWIANNFHGYPPAYYGGAYRGEIPHYEPVRVEDPLEQQTLKKIGII